MEKEKLLETVAQRLLFAQRRPHQHVAGADGVERFEVAVNGPEVGAPADSVVLVFPPVNGDGVEPDAGHKLGVRLDRAVQQNSVCVQHVADGLAEAMLRQVLDERHHAIGGQERFAAVQADHIYGSETR